MASELEQGWIESLNFALLQHVWLCATCSPSDKMWGFRFDLGGSKADGSLSYQSKAKVESLGL